MSEHMWKHNNEISCWDSELFLEQEIVNSLFVAGTGGRPAGTALRQVAMERPGRGKTVG